ncbi:50S ribosomal protein L18 [Bacteroidales bacterium OttesenSCG-928-B11]|nr:50S ribosomal protein L18 [Bacteroidales bacterium OttesenSCG-928-E04]MDL2309267.1 50S ribosomal protein L18 [Bacteroidales bacterium OttesenSCG-928-C03]MDL2312347.1 50S ribosomal protein L18 [Bacteroidales bacterium OttesenSCG-928-B11]MDL2326293.1 50S ribosomal protein L18 [Bacteroidales bacterium OttesenSCG-928-A14]
MAKNKEFRRIRIKHRVRKVVTGTTERPRLSVFRSNRDIYVQLIDDNAGHTLVSCSSAIPEIRDQKGTKIEKSAMVGKLVAQKAQEAGISKVVFDRNGYLYHGRVKSLADAAREGGLIF